MNIDDLISELEQVKEEHGNLETNVEKSLDGCVAADTLWINRQVKIRKSNPKETTEIPEDGTRKMYPAD